MRVSDDQVIDAEKKHIKISFTDGSEVVVKEITDAAPPYFEQVSGKFSADIKTAILRWSCLRVQ